MAGGLRILIVEDDASVRRSVGRLLRASGYECVEYDTAEALLGAEDPGAWDCLVTDMHLPGLTGLDLIETIRRSGVSMPAVLVTAYNEQKTRDSALRHHRVAFLAKPFEGAALLHAICKVTLT